MVEFKTKRRNIRSQNIGSQNISPRNIPPAAGVAHPAPRLHFAARSALRSAVALSLAGVFSLVGCGEKKPAGPAGPPPALPVGVTKVAATDVALTGEWVGTMDGYVNAQIQPQVSGYLIRQTYREGSPVSKGQVLFQIDPRPFQATLDQALGQLEQAKSQVGQSQAQLGLAQINVKRDTPLAQARAIAQSTLDNDVQQAAQYEASVKAAEANVKAAEATVESAKLNLGFTQVRSIIGGVAGAAATQVGNLVSSSTVLTSVSQLNPIKVYFSISDGEYLALTGRAREKGGSLLHGAGNIPLTLTLSNGNIYPLKGHIAFVDRQINSQTGAIRIAAAFPNADNVLRPGQFGRIKAETEVRHNVILVPQAAVSELQGIHQVYTVGSDNKAHVANVVLGPQYKNSWIIASGLSGGETIILDNLQKLRDGAPVSPHPAASLDAPTSQTSGQQEGK